MKNELTVNALAFGNLKQHKKQYTVMIIGIVLAMVFSSSVIFMLSSMYNSFEKIRNERYGKQSVILVDANEDEVKKAKENEILGKSGYAHIIGSLKSEDETYHEEIKLGWLDDTASELANPILIEGRMPTAENEIAIEKMTLAKLGLSAKVGDEITVNLYPQNGREAWEEGRPATYKLVGILKNKASYINQYRVFDGNCIPSAFVCKNTNVEIGGKENLVCYARYFDDRETTENNITLSKFLLSIGYNQQQEMGKFIFFNMRIVSSVSSVDDEAYDVKNTGIFTIIIVLVLMIASCLVIVNSFNSNLNERKKQIGMFRAIGATKRQIRRIFAREAFIICLISTPVSCLISAAVVKTVAHFMGEMFVFEPSVWAVVLAVVFCILCVMISSAVPLFSASRITPIQSIRNIENTRTLNKKKIQSKKNFDVPKLLASRSLTFSKAKQITMSVILIIATVGSGFALSFYSYEKKNIMTIDSDYRLGWSRSIQDRYYYYVNYSNIDTGGYTEHAKRFIKDNEYIGDSYGEKIGKVNLLIPTDTSDYRMFLMGNYTHDDYFSDPGAILDETNCREHLFSKSLDSPDKRKMRELLNVNDFASTQIISYDADYLKSFEKYVYDGKINIDKINSGEEIILYAPQKVGMGRQYDQLQEAMFINYSMNDDVDKSNCFFKAESDFRAGDEIEIAVLRDDAPIENEDPNIDRVTIPDDVKVTRKKVKIGALISECGEPFLARSSAVITSTPVMNSLIPNLKYTELNFNLNTPCTDEVERSVMEDINYICSDIEEASVHSNYGYTQGRKDEMNMFLTASMSIVILLFVISLSIINNTLTSDIRNSKSKIGTLRAVGADERSVVKSYIYQLMSMLLWGSGIGLGAFFTSYYLAYLIYFIYDKKTGLAGEWSLICNPAAAIIFIILAFLICSLNLWLKVRKEMKNSIVENIREL